MRHAEDSGDKVAGQSLESQAGCPHFAFCHFLCRGCAITAVQERRFAFRECQFIMSQRQHFLLDGFPSGYDFTSRLVTSIPGGPDTSAILNSGSWTKTFEKRCAKGLAIPERLVKTCVRGSLQIHELMDG